MTAPSFTIRKIRQGDNNRLAKIIRDTIIEFGLPETGTVFEDAMLDTLYEYYLQDKAVYFVLEAAGTVVGGAGIAALENYDGTICELQKMYFIPEVRGKGFGETMIEKCFEAARSFGYTHCYLETMPYMKAARKLYRRTGFKDISGPMGDTGHYSCSRWMIKELL
jgi:putative acetyltransferase